MKTTVRRGEVRTAISEESRTRLKRLLQRIAGSANVPALGKWRNMSSDDLWWQIVQQVCVMGSARGMEAMAQDKKRKAAFKEETSLRNWKRHRFDAKYLAGVMRAFAATRFHRRAARTLQKITNTRTAVRGGHVVLLENFPRVRDVNVRRDALMIRCPVFKRKSASDFMISVGLSHDVIALDQRIVGTLRKYLGFNLPFQRVQASRAIYLSVEATLRIVCREAGSSLAILDRALFRFEGMTAIQYIIEHGLDRR